MLKSKAEAALVAKFGAAKSAELLTAARALAAQGSGPDEIAQKLSTEIEADAGADAIVPSTGIVVVAV